jgi:2-enoate reductase
MNPFENLFKPMKIGNVTIKNRFCMAPMGGFFFNGPQGEFGDFICDYFTERAKSGFGLIFTGEQPTDNVIDRLDGPTVFTNPGIFLSYGVRLTERVHIFGAKIFPQISMGLGRCGMGTGWGAPSEIPLFWDPSKKTFAYTKDQIKQKIELVVKAAAVMKSAGFDGVEVHALHAGYTLDMFAMSVFNHRTDEYGGTLENRLRCCKEIVEGIKQVCGQNFPVSIRLGVKTYMRGLKQSSLHGENEVGRTLEEGVQTAKMLETYGYDAINIDAGTYDAMYHVIPPMYMEKGSWLTLADALKKEVSIPILTAGRMDDPYMADQAVASGRTDGVVIGRACLADPKFVQKIMMNKLETIRPCIACNQGCLGHALMCGGEAGCAVNPSAVRSGQFGFAKTLRPKKVMVVGGGVAGMEAARIAKMRGHEVELYEKSTSLGGQLLSGGAHTFKRDVASLNKWYQRELSELNVPVHIGHEIDSDLIKFYKPDVVILAVGAYPVTPQVPGIQDEKVSVSTEVLLGHKKAGNNVVVVGGGLVGCELALELAQEGKQVTIVEMLDDILSSGPQVPPMNSMMLRDLLEEHKVEIKAGMKLACITEKGAEIMPRDGGESIYIDADSIVISIGFKPQPSIAQELYAEGIETYEVGDGYTVGNILLAIHSAYEVARTL